MVQVVVSYNNVDQAIRKLKKKLQYEGLLRQMRIGRYHETPSQERKRKCQESARRIRKLQRKISDKMD